MCSVPDLPEVGSHMTIHVGRVSLNSQTILVEFGGNLNHEQEAIDVYPQLRKNLEAIREQQQTFEGKPGEVCLVCEDGAWHRARILLKSKHEYKLFLIDDGKLLWASSKILTKCPRSLCGLPPKVELCILASVSPLCLESAWSQAASEFIRSLCGKNLSGCIQDVIMPFRIILLDIPSISKQMYELGFARKMPNEDFKSLVMHSLHLPRNPSIQTNIVTINGQQEHASDPDNLHQYLYPELLPGTIEIVNITQVVHPLKFFCKLDVFSHELKKLSDQLHAYYEDAFTAQMPMPLSDGSPCATKGSDGNWYRSVLQQNNISDVFKVFHVDYGIEDFVKLCNIRPLSARFFQLPVVTYGCSLHGIIDKGLGWSTDQIDYLKSVVLNQILIGKFEHHSVNEGVYYITLYGNDNENVNNTFGRREQCLSVTKKIRGDPTLETLNKVTCKYMRDRNMSLYSLHPPNLTRCSNSLEDVTVVRPSRTEENVKPAEGGRLSNIAPPLQSDGYVDSPPKIEVGSKKKVRITYVQSVNQFYGHFAQNADIVRRITKDIQQLCCKRPQEKFSISPNMMCLAKYADGKWHRGQIESTHPKILVQFIDYGDLVVLDKSDILPFPPKASTIASTPIQAVQFELFNVTLPEPCEINEWFKNYTTDCIFTVIVKNSSSKLSVEMFDDKTNLNLKIKAQWNKTKRNLGKGTDKTRTFEESSEGMESRGVRHNLSTASQEHEKTSQKLTKPVVQGTLEENFQCLTSQTTIHSRARPNLLQQEVTCYPKLTDLPSKALDAGCVSDIYVSHCNSPSSFFVQLANDEDKIFSLLDKLNSAQLSDSQVELNLLQSGDLVRAEYPADGAWYRAVVQNKSNSMVQVQFIDFGNEATLLPLKIRQLCKQFLGTPRLSVHCTVEDGRRKREWTQEEILTFKKAAGENGEKKIQCHFIREDTSVWFVCLEYQGVELEEPLFNAALKSGAQTELQICYDNLPLTFKGPAFTHGQIVEAYASSIDEPNYFWCQFKNSEELDTISLLAQEIGNCSRTKVIQPDQLRQGGLCLARFSDQLWYRAQVINIHDKTVSVLFIDYGNESEIELSFIKSLPTKLMESPPQAFLCQLEALESTDGTWSNAAADKFFELLLDEPLKVTIRNTLMSSDLPKCPWYSVLVECKGLIVNDLMQDYWCHPKPQVCSKVRVATKKQSASKDNFGVTSSEIVQKAKTPKLNSSTRPSSDNVNHDLNSFDSQTSQNEFNQDGLQRNDGCQLECVAAITQDKSIMNPTSTEDGNLLAPEQSAPCLSQVGDLPHRVIEPGTVSEVYVSHINSLASFFVQLAMDENTIFSLCELLNSPQPSEKNEMSAFIVQQGSLVKAKFPKDDSWYRAVVKDTTENDKIQVEFIDFGNEATVSRLEIHKLDEQLLSYPRFSIHCTCSVDDLFTTQEMEEIKDQKFLFKQIFGDAGENTLSCKFIKDDLITWEVKMTPSGSSYDLLCEKWDNLDLNALLVVSKPVQETFQLLFKKPDVSLGQTVEAFASCILEPNYFWCQFSNSVILDQISCIAQQYGNSSETLPILLDNLGPGSPCLACFCEDQMWYRAQVINKSTNTVSVQFVDFGNESEISEGSVKALPCDLLESPPQAFLCRLEGFDTSPGLCDSVTTDTFYELVVDRPLKVTVESIANTLDPNSPPYYVTVESPQCLVNEHMAKLSKSAQSSQNSASTSVDQSVSGDKTSLNLAISSEENHTSEPHCAEQHGGGNEIKLLVVNQNKVDDQLGEDDIANDSTRTNSVLEVQDVCHESEDGVPVGSTEPMLLHSEENGKDMEDSEKDILMTPRSSSDWVAGLENQMLPMVCTEDSCGSKCIFK